jgi:hypothetical protein
MDDGYLECPCCGAYRPSGCLREGMTHTQQMAAIRRALAAEQRAAQRVAREYGILLPRYADSGLHHEAAS